MLVPVAVTMTMKMMTMAMTMFEDALSVRGGRRMRIRNNGDRPAACEGGGGTMSPTPRRME